MSMQSDVRDCQRLMRGGSKSFFAASRFLPADIRQSAMALYAFCRVADDAVDLIEEDASGGRSLAEKRHQALRDLYQRLDNIYANRPLDHPADRAFARLVHQQSLPKVLPLLLLEGFAWDAQGRGYETVEALDAYAVRVAGSVGLMMAWIMGVRQPMVLASACEMGMAMQMTNIARDVGEDARAGRLYLPMQWMREAGIQPQSWLKAPRHDDALASVVSRLLAHADALYQHASWAIDYLPWRCRPAIRAAGSIYAEIGREIERYALDSVNRRAIVGASRKWQLMFVALTRCLRSCVVPLSDQVAQLTSLPASVRPVIEDLLDSGQAAWQPTAGPSARGLAGLAEVFERLDSLDRQQRAKQHPGFRADTPTVFSG